MEVLGRRLNYEYGILQDWTIHEVTILFEYVNSKV